ncbi:iron-sulfur cluster carrier protein ApbC [Pseudovibrio exalbescens]|uniref:iron-sulfur cluster carrier protein ApbC n=1 Tax=Pseudovibrio exalbescens TaxID=197461 RepID=UPI0023655E2B|nr:iron-sulfur cluster carrier protein ApbC [Pseudovibrio exalbescens]MDD7909053.1 iron-sulfur cluster carrier protein ApbC [Pseudovibrio exalbescens]
MFWKKGRQQEDELTNERVLEVLQQVKDPTGTSNIVEKQLVSDISILNGRVVFSIKIPANEAERLEGMRKAAEKIVSVLPGVEKVMAVLTAEKTPGRAPASAPIPSAPAAAVSSGPAAQKSLAPETQASRPSGGGKLEVPGVANIIAVASGKGGVGKSTTSANLAIALSRLGLRVGLLDADIYGPSVPKLMGVSGKPELVEGRIMKPMEAHGIKLMSIGFLVDEETAMIWRGPMVTSALNQMLREVAWGELDVLVVDMPPGTGDVQLTMAQKVPLTGSIVVSTPQDLALLDARRGVAMFEKVSIPVIGVIENMSHFVCPDCGGRHEIFGHGGAREEARKMKVPFLGEVPLTMELRMQSDAGTPIVAAAPDSTVSHAYMTIGEEIKTALENKGEVLTKPAPRIVIE